MSGPTSSLGDCTPALSVLTPNFARTDPGDWSGLLDLAGACDDAGVDRVVMSDHVVLGEDLEAYGRPGTGGAEGAKQPTGPDGQWLEPITALSVIAGATTRVRLHTAVLLAALRRPTVLAKQLATLDALSCGRLDLGVGVGWQREEYEACGLDYHRRGRLLDQTLEVMHALWTEEPASYEGDGLAFEGIHCNPKPVQAGGLPVWVAGTLNERVLARMGRFGTGWIPWGPDAKDPTAGVARCREAIEGAGRSVEHFQVSGRLPVVMTDDGQVDLEASMAPVPGLVEAGITDFRAYLPIPAGRAAATDYLSPVVTVFRAAVGR